MKEILIPLNFMTTPTVYDTKQSFSTSDEASGVLTFTTTADVAGTVASLTIRNASENANRQTILIERLDVNRSPFSYTFKNPLPFGQYEGTVLLKKNLTVIASASFLFGVNSSLSAEVLPDLVKAYSLDELVENVETEVSNLKDAFNVTVSETVKGVNKTESSLQAQENVRYLNEHQRKANELERIANENARIAAEVERKDTFDTLVDSEVIEQTVVQEVAEKYQEIEALNAPEIVSFRQQLADKVGGGVKAEPEDLSATTLGLVTGTGGPINLLSIPQDKSATWAKRTETGSFAKILLTGKVPNFNTSTGILTFPSDFRVLVGTNYYSIAATTIDFSAIVSTASQILILFDVSTLAFTAISPTSLTSAHDRSVIVATIKNVSGQRREPYMNCPFSVNNIPYIPDIERMLLSKAIPQTEQVVQYHASGVINNIQHKDSNGNTIRTDTFTFSPTAIVEERKHNLSNTKITFTTNLSTFTTEVN